jgi:hypothetical protein
MTTIEQTESPSRYAWQHGEYTGTITFAADERGPTRIEWDQPEAPENWEDIEERIVTAASTL